MPRRKDHFTDLEDKAHLTSALIWVILQWGVEAAGAKTRGGGVALVLFLVGERARLRGRAQG